MPVAYVQSPAEDNYGEGVRVFLAGGAKEKWRARLAESLRTREAPWILYDPINFDWHRDALDRRIDWEIRYFERADVVAAWLPAAPAHDFSAQSPTTCFELGQLAVIKAELHVGISPQHPGRATLVERLRRHAPAASIADSLEELAARVPSACTSSRLVPPRLDEERHFHFGVEIGFDQLFDLGVAVRTQRVQVTIDPASPILRELTAQLARLR